jgi:hypothetical protein
LTREDEMITRKEAVILAREGGPDRKQQKALEELLDTHMLEAANNGLFKVTFTILDGLYSLRNIEETLIFYRNAGFSATRYSTGICHEITISWENKNG